jgi:hypothetical protein
MSVDDYERLRAIVRGEVDWEPDEEWSRLDRMELEDEQLTLNRDAILDRVEELEDERDRLRDIIAEMSERQARLVQQNSEAVLLVARLREENAKLKRWLELPLGPSSLDESRTVYFPEGTSDE